MTAHDPKIAPLPTDLYIDGQFRPGAEGTRFDVLNPATEEVIASVASAELADAAVEAIRTDD